MATIDTKTLLTPAQAAPLMGVSLRRVQRLCADGRLGLRIGRTYFIPRDEAKKFRPNPPGRPPAKH